MTNDILQHIVLAGLLHDIGKLFERAEIFPEARKDDEYLSRCRQDKGHATHLHSAHTAAFCDWLEKQFGCLRKTSCKDWKIWCAAHHRDDESALESTVIRLADRLSSSEREEGDYYRREIHRKTLLEPILERIFLEENQNNFATTRRYPLKRLSSTKEDQFPQRADTLQLHEMDHPEKAIDGSEQWNHMMADGPMIDEYRQLGEGFMNDMESLSRQHPEVSLDHLLITLMSLLEKYTANVPSATNVRHPDISLFDHLRTTAAIAQGLYLFQKDLENPMEGIADKQDPKWILICGDFSGIQKFIYNLTNKGAAKGLRGRSLYVQLFCRICASYLLDQAGMSQAGLLYNSGGKFYILAPATYEKRFQEARARINQWLLQTFEGAVFLGLGITRVTGAMFHQGEMSKAWEQAAYSLERDRLTWFRDNMDSSFFEPATGFNPTDSCTICGSRKMDGSQEWCPACENLKNIGIWLKDSVAVLIVAGDTAEKDRIAMALNARNFLRFPELERTVFLLSENQMESLSELRKVDAECILLNQFGDQLFNSMQLPCCAVSTLYVGKWESGRQVRADGSDWDFEDYAENSVGIKRLGILRMDVDNLGMVFIKGLQFPIRENKGWGEVIRDTNGMPERKEMASLSRMATLSRQLQWFFSGYVPTLLEKPSFDRCQIIYAGGDDLFVIGSWDQLPGLAKTIRNEFREFCCDNPDFSISGGITLHGGRFPVYKGAQAAGDAEKQAKEIRSKWVGNTLQKDGFCFLGTPIVWEDMNFCEAIRDMLESDIQSGDRGWLSWLTSMTAANQIMVEQLVFKNRINQIEAWKEIVHSSWRWRTAYQLRRRFRNQEAAIDKWSGILFADTFQKEESTLPVYSWLAMPLRWTDYQHREKGEK